ncbi:MAG: hypothetical protein AAF802_18420 [Planctomycetota bacterium]
MSPSQTASLVETVPAGVVQSSVRTYRRVLVLAVVGFSCLVTSTVALDGDIGWQSALIGGLCLLTPGTLFVIGLAAVMRHELGIRIPKVELLEDELVVRYGNRVLNANVKDCRLRRGRASMMRLPGCPKLHCDSSVILIDIPQSALSTRIPTLWVTRVKVAVGYTDDSRVLWERALTPKS